MTRLNHLQTNILIAIHQMVSMKWTVLKFDDGSIYFIQLLLIVHFNAISLLFYFLQLHILLEMISLLLFNLLNSFKALIKIVFQQYPPYFQLVAKSTSTSPNVTLIILKVIFMSKYLACFSYLNSIIEVIVFGSLFYNFSLNISIVSRNN